MELYIREQEPVQLEIEQEQVTHPDLTPYQIGHPHYEALMRQVAQAQRFTAPEDLRFNF